MLLNTFELRRMPAQSLQLTNEADIALYNMFHGKLLFEVSIGPAYENGLTLGEFTRQFNCLSLDSMAKGILQRHGTGIFTTGSAA